MAIDFDGTDDGYDVDIGAFGTGMGNVFFAQGFINYDAAINNRTIFNLTGSSSNDFARLYKNGTTLTWLLVDNSGPEARSVSVTISSQTWYGFQCYYDVSNDVIGLRVWTTGLPGSFTTDTCPPVSGLDTFHVAYTGSGEYFNGRIAELFISQYAPGLATENWDAVVNGMAAMGSPRQAIPVIYQHAVVDSGAAILGMWWRMRATTETRDVLHSTLLAAVNAPSTASSHPRVTERSGRRVVREPILLGNATLAATATVASTPRRTRQNSSSLTATGTVAATPTRTRQATCSVSATGSLTGTATRTRQATCDLLGTATLTGDAARTRTSAALLEAIASAIATGRRTRTTSASLLALATLTASAEEEAGAVQHIPLKKFNFRRGRMVF